MSKLKFWYKYNLMRSPVYYYWHSLDCDLCSSGGYGECKNITEYQANEELFWECVEGPSGMRVISREEYLENKDIEIRSRDYIMEAFEDGRGSNVII